MSTIASLPSYSLSFQSLGTKTPVGFSQVSGLTYSGSGDTYYGISNESAAKFYTIKIDVTGNTFNSVTKVGTNTTLKDSGGTALSNKIDAEGIALSGSNIFVSTEGNYTPLNPFAFDNSVLTSPANLFIRRFNIATGNQDTAAGNDLTLASRYTTSTTTTGLRNNLAFESLTISPDQSRLFSAVEAPLKEDQALATLQTSKDLIRILRFNLVSGIFTAGEEYLYETEMGFGLADLLAIDNNILIALERKADISGSITGIGVFELSIAGATDISANTGLTASGTSGITKVQKTSITFDIPLSPSINYEGLTFGETLADGRPTIFFVSDNNLDENAVTNFAAYAVVPFDFEPSLGFLALGSLYLGKKILEKNKKSKKEL
ncbi:esterase-like activity of phytase family protein [Pseudanabaena sp. FACHB-1998]|uniref:PFE-CTERM domain-containing protein n=1 Tax=Pseudanabaena sp. FACHB-1998 TaxID=2692858 RepID=UPI0016819ACA|nr:esterase-like activity of phytase family protein [Pseudanabaena sp. FACHB-1998]